MTNNPKELSEKFEEAENEQSVVSVQLSEEVTVQEDTAPEKDMINYAALDRQTLIERLRKLANVSDADSVKEDIDAIKFHFYRKLKAEEDLARQKYIDNGGIGEEYTPEEDAQELILKTLLNTYREIRNAQREQQEAEKQRNFEEKLQIIEELKELTNSGDSIGENFQTFRDLQHRWRAKGSVPQSEMKNLWDTYHHYVEVFYDFIKINKDLRDLDFKHNLEIKIGLCEKAEALLSEASVVNAFHALQNFHDQWREIGPVPKEMRVEIWDRFKAVSSQINKKHQEYFESQKETQKQNLEAKEALCVRVEEIGQQALKTISQWEKKSKEIVEIQKLWNSIGFTMKKDNIKLYKRFQSVCDDFFNRKRDFYKTEKTEQDHNLQSKEDLCVQAEALKDSTDWNASTETIIRLQKTWKEIGNVPAKYRDPIWQRFRAACNYFFEQRTKHFSPADSEYDQNLKAKQDLVSRIQQFVPFDHPEKNLEQLKNFQREWNEIGFVPIKHKKKIQDEFHSVISKQFDSLNLNEKDRDMSHLKLKIEHPTTTAPHGKIERSKLMRQYKQLQSDLIVWENNIGFFSKSKNSKSNSSNAMIASVERMIEEGRNEIKELKNKIEMIDQLDVK